MSHAATNWAIQQRGLKPATKIVLWFLCDRHNPDFGCFPTQARLAEDAEMSISALNEHLTTLEDVASSTAFAPMIRTITGVCQPVISSGSNRDSRKSHLRKAKMDLLNSWKKMTPHLRNPQIGPSPDFRAFQLRIFPKAISGIRSITL